MVASHDTKRFIVVHNCGYEATTIVCVPENVVKFSFKFILNENSSLTVKISSTIKF